MADPKFKKGDWVVRIDGEPNEFDTAAIGDMRQVDEDGDTVPYVTHQLKGQSRDAIHEDDYRLATPEELERVK